MDNSSTHLELDLNLWLEARSTDGPNTGLRYLQHYGQGYAGGLQYLDRWDLAIGIEPTISSHPGDCTRTSLS